MQRLPRKLLRLLLKSIVSVLLTIIMFAPGTFWLIGISFTIVLAFALVLTFLAIILDLISLPSMAVMTRYWRSKILAPIIKWMVKLLRRYNFHQAIIGMHLYREASNFYFTEKNAKTVFPQQWDNGFFPSNTILFTACTVATTATTFFFITKIHMNIVRLFIVSL